MNNLILALLLISPVSGHQDRAQRVTRATASMYRLNFTLHVIEDGIDKTRTFMLVLEERSSGKLRNLTKLPIRQSDTTQYVETGIKCDVQFQESEGKLRLEAEVHFSYSPVSATPPSEVAPVIYEWQSRVEATVIPNEVTVLTAYDGGEGGRKYQLDIKAEKLR